MYLFDDTTSEGFAGLFAVCFLRDDDITCVLEHNRFEGTEVIGRIIVVVRISCMFLVGVIVVDN